VIYAVVIDSGIVAYLEPIRGQRLDQICRGGGLVERRRLASGHLVDAQNGVHGGVCFDEYDIWLEPYSCDVTVVRAVSGIGSRLYVTAIVRPGCPVVGHCIPVDLIVVAYLEPIG